MIPREREKLVCEQILISMITLLSIIHHGSDQSSHAMQASDPCLFSVMEHFLHCRTDPVRFTSLLHALALLCSLFYPNTLVICHTHYSFASVASCSSTRIATSCCLPTQCDHSIAAENLDKVAHRNKLIDVTCTGNTYCIA